LLPDCAGEAAVVAVVAVDVIVAVRVQRPTVDGVQARRIVEKTGTTRQAELVKLVAKFMNPVL
jgi:hypothetical protein